MRRSARLLAHEPFFPLAALWAAVAVPWWLAVRNGRLSPPDWADPALWHAHEMLLGFAGAAMAGFLVTRARPRTVLLLGAFWLLGRAAFWLPPEAALLLLPSFPALLALLVAPAFFRSSRKAGNLAFGVIPIGLFLLELLFALTATAPRPDLAVPAVWSLVLLVSALLALMGGRIIRAATAGLAQRLGGRQPAGIDLPREALTLGLLLLAVLGTLLAMDARVTGAALLAAGLVTAGRLARWFLPAIGRAPELWALHLGYGWLAAGLVVLGLAFAGVLVAPADGVHAAMIGGLGTLAFTVVARTAAERAGKGLAAAAPVARWAPLLSLAALARLAVPLFPEPALFLLWLSALLWSAAFLRLALFLLSLRRPMLGAAGRRQPGRRS